MSNQEFVPSDEEMMALLNGTADEALQRKVRDSPKIQKMVHDTKRLADWLRSNLSEPTPEQITAYVLNELTENERAYIELFTTIDETYRMEIEASQAFLMEQDALPEITLGEQDFTPQKSAFYIVPAQTQRVLLASFRKPDDPLELADSWSIRTTAEGVEISITLEVNSIQIILSGSVLADNEATWENAIIEIWHESKLSRVTRLKDWTFRCEVPNVSPLEARLISGAGTQILIPLARTNT